MANLIERKEGRDKLLWACSFLNGPDVNKCRKWQPLEYDACEMVARPDKIAEMIVFECGRFGIAALDFPYGARATLSQSLPENAVIIYHSNINGGSLDIYPENSRNSRLVGLPDVRKILAEFLRLPDGDADGARRVLRGGK